MESVLITEKDLDRVLKEAAKEKDEIKAKIGTYLGKLLSKG